MNCLLRSWLSCGFLVGAVGTSASAALLDRNGATRFFTADDASTISNNGPADGNATWVDPVSSTGPDTFTFDAETVVINAVTGGSTVVENAIAFDGTLAASTASPFASSTPTATFEFFVRPEANPNTAASLLFETGGSGNGLSVGFTNANQVAVSTEVGFTLEGSLAGIDLAEFLQIVVVHDGPNDLVSLYINGALAGSTDQLTDSVTEAVGGNNAASLGGAATSSINLGVSTENFTGEIAGFRFYAGTALNSTQVSDSYTAFVPEPSTMALTVLGGTLIAVRRRHA
ncbi:MAG: LamG-like jellyroll fold domain-containing protein [Planctomycetota bacterium]